MAEWNWWFNEGISRFDLKNKVRQKQSYIRYMLDRTQSMFRYENLPETIPQRELEIQLQMTGHVGFVHVDGNLYALRGGFGGEPNPYYMPTQYVIANPALRLSKTYNIDDDVIVVKNDSMYMGLLPMFNRYASQIVENDISMLLAIINSRIVNLIIAGDDSAKASADEYLKKINNGDMGVIGDSKIIEAIRTQPYALTSSRIITELIESQQYLKAGWFNELGLNANYNMKREAINADEAQMNNDALYPLVDDMLRCRQEGIEKVNEMFGTDIRVEFNSVWEIKQDELEAIPEQMEAEEEISSEAGADPAEADEDYVEPVEEEAAELPAEDFTEQFEEVKETVEEILDIVEDMKEGESDEASK